MGILNKFKNMFTEEIDEESDEAVKKEVIRVEIPSPVEKGKKDMPKARAEKFSQMAEQSPKKDIFKNAVDASSKESTPVQREETFTKPKEEEKFTFPVFFDDDDFDTFDQKTTKREEKKSEPYGGKKKEAKKEPTTKKFKPTPIISPIYGVLDKNYKKEDITCKDEKNIPSSISKEMTIDDLRKKAYGTLEDDLENELFHDTAYDKPAVYREEKDMFEDLNMLEEDLFPPTQSRSERTENIVQEEIEKNVDDKAETDLFELIDSMYEKGEDI